MEQGSTTGDADGTGLFAGNAWFDPIEAGIRKRVCKFIEELLEQELTQALGRGKSERAAGEPKGYRNGTRERQLLGSFGPVEVEVPRARMAALPARWSAAASSGIITYTRADKAGTSLHAAGWVQESTVRGRSWHSPRRSRSNTNAHIDKVRWSRTLRPRTSPSGNTRLLDTPAPDLMQEAEPRVRHPGLILER